MKGLFLVFLGFCCLSVIAQEPRMILPESYADFKEIAFNPNGKQLLVSAGDSTILLFDVNTGRRLYSLKTLNNDISFNSSGDLFICSSYNGDSTVVYKTKTGTVFRKFKGSSPVFSVNEKYISLKNDDLYPNDSLYTYEVQSGKILNTTSISGSLLECYKNQNSLLLEASSTLPIYDYLSQEVEYIDVKTKKDEYIYYAKLSPDSSEILLLLSNFNNDRSRLVSLNTNSRKVTEVLYKFKKYEIGNNDHNLLFDKTGNYLFINTRYFIHAFDLKSNTVKYAIEKNGYSRGMEIKKGLFYKKIKDNEILISISRNKLNFYNANHGALIYELEESEHIKSISIHPIKPYVAVLLESGEIFIWDFIKQRKIIKVKNEVFSFSNQSFSRDNNSLLVTNKINNRSYDRLYNLKTGKESDNLKFKENTFYSPDKKYVISFSQSKVSVSDFENKIKRWSYVDWELSGVDTTLFSFDNKTLLIPASRKLFVFNINTGETLKILDYNRGSQDIEMSPCGNYFLLQKLNQIELYSVHTAELIHTFRTPSKFVDDYFLSPNGNYLFIQDLKSQEIYSMKSYKKLYSFNRDKYSSIYFSNDDKYFISQKNNSGSISWNFNIMNEIELYEIEENNSPNVLEENNMLIDAVFHPKPSISQIVTITQSDPLSTLSIYDFDSLDKVIDLYTSKNTIISSKWSPQGNFIFLIENTRSFNSKNSNGRLIDSSTGKLLLTINNCTSGTFSSDGRLLLTKDVVSNKSSLWDLKTFSHIYSRIQLQDHNYLITLPNSKYYMCSKDASKMVHYVTDDLKVIGFEQLDPVYNRPDKVLEHIAQYLDGVDPNLIDVYRRAWERRADLLGLNREMLADGSLAVPDAEITNTNEIDYFNTSGTVNIDFSAQDKEYKLLRFNVLVNEVPLYGATGISLANRNIQNFDTTLQVPLSVGNNKIQVSVMNELGLENFQYPTYVNYTPAEEIPSKTIFIGIAVDSFQQENYNLSYCVKDINDLSAVFKQQPNTEIITLSNSQVTKENVLALKQRLAKTSIHDRVIISCSSHGDLDKNNKFYLATHDMNFNAPELRGIPYRKLEGLLDSIPARKKLLLLDACNSGLNDMEMTPSFNEWENEELLADGENKRGASRVNVQQSNDEFQTMLELFVNVQNKTGTIVVSAAGGAEAAFEGVEINGQRMENGVFTHSLLEYIAQQQNGTILVNDLKKYLEDRVEELTNGLQRPTSRQETMEVDWELWE